MSFQVGLQIFRPVVGFQNVYMFCPSIRHETCGHIHRLLCLGESVDLQCHANLSIPNAWKTTVICNIFLGFLFASYPGSEEKNPRASEHHGHSIRQILILLILFQYLRAKRCLTENPRGRGWGK